MAGLSRQEQCQVEVELNRLVERCRSQARPLTQQKIASLMGNAIFIVRYVRTGKARSWRGNYWKRRRLWERVQQRRNLEQFKAKPIWQRRKFLDIG